ncbi:MAG: Flp pilus assembly protein CpaB [Planctomycetaceae bacterium]
MSLKSIVFALVFAGSVTAGAHVLIRRSSTDPPARPTKQVVLVADRVGRGQVLTAGELKLAKVDAEAVPPGAFFDMKSAVGRVARSTILPGILLKTQLMQAGGSGLPALIQPGHVAHTIKLPQGSAGLLPFLRPKDRVDVQLVLNAQGASANGQSRDSRVIRLLSNVEVLAVGDQLSDYQEHDDVKSESNSSQRSGIPSIALLLTKIQSLRLGLGESKGQLVVTLRNAQSESSAETGANEMTLSELLGEDGLPVRSAIESTVPGPSVASQNQQAPPAAATPPDAERAAPTSRRIVVYYGTQRREQILKLRQSPRVAIVLH